MSEASKSLSDEEIDFIALHNDNAPPEAYVALRKFARAVIAADRASQASAQPPVRDAAFKEFCRLNCSPGAEGAKWYQTIWNEAWRAALASTPHSAAPEAPIRGERPGKAEWEDFKRAASGASPEPTAEAILKLDEWVAADHMSLSEQHAFRMGFREARHRAAALASGAPTPEPTDEQIEESVGNQVGYCHGAWDMVPIGKLISAFRAALAPQVGAPGPGSVDPVASSGTRPAAAIPEGWRLVPIAPTTAMKIAGDNVGFWCGDKWAAMLAAAPQPCGRKSNGFPCQFPAGTRCPDCSSVGIDSTMPSAADRVPKQADQMEKGTL